MVKPVPRADQARDIKRLEDMPHRTLLNYSETGTGKTIVIIQLLINLGLLRGIIIAKGRLLINKWVAELAKYDLRGLVVTTPKEYKPGYDFYIFSYAAIRSKASTVMHDLAATADVVVLDEAHNVGGKSQQSKLLQAFLRDCDAKKIIMATATPIGKSAAELPTQLAVGQHTDLARALKRNLQWQRRYIGRRMITECTGWRDRKAVGQMLKPYVVRTTKQEAFGDSLPPMMHSDIQVDISAAKLEKLVRAKLGKDKDDMKRFAAMDAIEAFFDDDHRTGDDNPYIMRVVQAVLEVCGVLKAPDIAEYADTLAETEKCVIFAHNYDVLDAVTAGLSSSHVLCDGRLSDSEMQGRYRAFVDDPELKVMVASYALSQGIDLICSRRMIIAQQHWSPLIMVQAKNRIHRAGQTGQTYCENVIASHVCGGLAKIESLLAENHRRKRAQTEVDGIRGTLS